MSKQPKPAEAAPEAPGTAPDPVERYAEMLATKKTTEEKLAKAEADLEHWNELATKQWPPSVPEWERPHDVDERTLEAKRVILTARNVLAHIELELPGLQREAERVRQEQGRPVCARLHEAALRAVEAEDAALAAVDTLAEQIVAAVGELCQAEGARRRAARALQAALAEAHIPQRELPVPHTAGADFPYIVGPDETPVTFGGSGCGYGMGGIVAARIERLRKTGVLASLSKPLNPKPAGQSKVEFLGPKIGWRRVPE